MTPHIWEPIPEFNINFEWRIQKAYICTRCGIKCLDKIAPLDKIGYVMVYALNEDCDEVLINQIHNS